MYRRAFIFSLIFAMCLFSACNYKQSQITSKNLQLKHESLKETLEFLTSDECNGRMTGTEGNLSAQRFIINSLESFGIEKFNGSYEDEFLYDHLSIDEIKLNTSEKKFIYGEDYYISKIANSDISCPLALEDSITDDCIVLVEEAKNMDELMANDKVKGILIKTDFIKASVSAAKRTADKTILCITNETFEYLKKNIGSVIWLKSSYTITKKPVNNIIGIVRGNNAKKAIVLSAHFDHLGGIGSHIFRGAIDNASGTTALLDIAKRIAKSAKEKNLDMDIIFAFFNAEEIGLLGSKDFAERIQNKYSHENIVNINIDCISKIDSAIKIDYSSTDLQRVVNELINQLNNKSIKNIEEPQLARKSNFGSDHVWFDNNIYIYMESDYTHTLKDTIAEVNIGLIEKISECIVDITLNFSNYKSQAAEIRKPATGDLVIDFIQEEERKLKPFEYKFLDINGEITYLWNYLLCGSYEKVNRCFNGDFNTIPLNKLINEALDDYFIIIFGEAKDIEYSSQKLDTVYKRNYKNSDISQFTLGVFRKRYDSSNAEVKDDPISIDLDIQKIDYNHKFKIDGEVFENRESQEKQYNSLIKEFGSDTFDYEGHKLHYKYIENIEHGQIQCISKNSSDQVKYVYSITTNEIKSFDKENIIKLIEDYDIFAVFEAIESLMNKPGEISYINWQE